MNIKNQLEIFHCEIIAVTCRINLAKMIIAGDEGEKLTIYQEEQGREREGDGGTELPSALVFHGTDQEDVKLQRLSEEVGTVVEVVVLNRNEE